MIYKAVLIEIVIFLFLIVATPIACVFCNDEAAPSSNSVLERQYVLSLHRGSPETQRLAICFLLQDSKGTYLRSVLEMLSLSSDVSVHEEVLKSVVKYLSSSVVRDFRLQSERAKVNHILLDLLPQLYGHARHVAATLLALNHYEDAYPLFFETVVLETPQASYLVSLSKSLIEMGFEEVLDDIFLTLISHPELYDETTCVQVLRCLFGVHPIQATRNIQAVLEAHNTSPAVRQEALRILGELRCRESVNLLISLIQTGKTRATSRTELTEAQRKLAQVALGRHVFQGPHEPILRRFLADEHVSSEERAVLEKILDRPVVGVLSRMKHAPEHQILSILGGTVLAPESTMLDNMRRQDWIAHERALLESPWARFLYTVLRDADSSDALLQRSVLTLLSSFGSAVNIEVISLYYLFSSYSEVRLAARDAIVAIGGDEAMGIFLRDVRRAEGSVERISFNLDCIERLLYTASQAGGENAVRDLLRLYNQCDVNSPMAQRLYAFLNRLGDFYGHVLTEEYASLSLLHQLKMLQLFSNKTSQVTEVFLLRQTGIEQDRSLYEAAQSALKERHRLRGVAPGFFAQTSSRTYYVWTNSKNDEILRQARSVGHFDDTQLPINFKIATNPFVHLMNEEVGLFPSSFRLRAGYQVFDMTKHVDQRSYLYWLIENGKLPDEWTLRTGTENSAALLDVEQILERFGEGIARRFPDADFLREEHIGVVVLEHEGFISLFCTHEGIDVTSLQTSEHPSIQGLLLNLVYELIGENDDTRVTQELLREQFLDSRWGAGGVAAQWVSNVLLRCLLRLLISGQNDAPDLLENAVQRGLFDGSENYVVSMISRFRERLNVCYGRERIHSLMERLNKLVRNYDASRTKPLQQAVYTKLIRTIQEMPSQAGRFRLVTGKRGLVR
ncbi:MAG: hypothetical protein HYS98_01380 [Deltaproteobacteria bacterium]|nr:hypothetical protein [Deltaproteobacteria bacterium]